MRTLLIVIVGLVRVGVAAAEQPERVWTDRSGTHKITARLAGFDEKDRVVKLIPKNGKLLRVALDRLSGLDRQFVAEYRRSADKTRRKENRVVRTRSKAAERKRLRAEQAAAARSGTARMYGIKWHGNLAAAQKEALGNPGDDQPGAGADPRQRKTPGGKPIFCFRVLGSLSGFM